MATEMKYVRKTFITVCSVGIYSHMTFQRISILIIIWIASGAVTPSNHLMVLSRA